MKRIKHAVLAVALTAGLAAGTTLAVDEAAQAAPVHSKMDTTWGCPGC